MTGEQFDAHLAALDDAGLHAECLRTIRLALSAGEPDAQANGPSDRCLFAARERDRALELVQRVRDIRPRRSET